MPRNAPRYVVRVFALGILVSRPQALTWPHGVMVPSQAMGTKGYRKDICLVPSLIRLYHALRPGKGAAGVWYSIEKIYWLRGSWDIELCDIQVLLRLNRVCRGLRI